MNAKPVDYNATIAHAEFLTDSLGIFRIIPDEPVGGFVPGQYAVLGLNHPEKGGVMRAYSIASAPQVASEYLEFYVRYIPEPATDNPLTHLLFRPRVGDRILMRRKLAGTFTIAGTAGEEDGRLRLLVAAGTGLAPFVSVVRESFLRTGSIGPHAIVHGASVPTDLGYRGELEAMMNGGAERRYVPTISRPHLAPEWEGFTGRVESLFEAGRIAGLEAALGLPAGGIHPGRCVVLVCGLSGTIGNTLMNLFHRGFVPGDRKLRRALRVPDEVKPSIFFEQYDTDPVLDVRDAARVASAVELLAGAGVRLESPSQD